MCRGGLAPAAGTDAGMGGTGTAAARLAARWQCAVSCHALLTAVAAEI